MTQHEIIEMAKQVDREFCCDEERFEWLEAFAKLVSAKEREACSKYVEGLTVGGTPLTVVMGAIGDAIRARGNPH
jgi:hypothetical protein